MTKSGLSRWQLFKGAGATATAAGFSQLVPIGMMYPTVVQPNHVETVVVNLPTGPVGGIPQK